MTFFTKKTVCVACGHEVSGDEIFEGCPKCKERGISANLSTKYDFSGYSQKELKDIYYNAPKAKGLWTHRAFLPIDDDIEPVSIGEGNTPLIHCKSLGKALGLKNLYIKNESQNPTWSYKDRLAAVGVTRAKQEKAVAVTVSSTGNHGAATAAMCAAAGIPCVVFTVAQVPQTMKTLMQSYGASVIVTPTMEDRWILSKKCVKEKNWYPLTGFLNPSIGSNPYGVDGYKTITFEIFDELGELPDYISVPCAHSDGLYGIWKGAKDLVETGITEKQTRMVAAEVYGSLKKSLELHSEGTVAVPTDGWSVSFSIGGGKATHQGYMALKESKGLAHYSSDPETMEMQLLLGRHEGIYAEASSVTSLVVIKKLVDEGKIDPNAKIVAIITSSGLKDPATTAGYLPEVPVIKPEIGSLKEALEKYYHVDLL
ncbi:threonine synthase [Qiania dongpingensis]|uniref:Pyridoxal-phosphate dependent enzyme n=1 Tax=Qiania dongpingensis TaxID=2763669 RepID=A0A7G9G7D0_9FIRM|nr:pyridoxal-phosphate dependent enzyme [Qiania dongpingensis]QNM06712.1 pyridoxal-phosphate dependent enzyme [Qiania dongpingensis]